MKPSIAAAKKVKELQEINRKLDLLIEYFNLDEKEPEAPAEMSKGEAVQETSPAEEDEGEAPAE